MLKDPWGVLSGTSWPLVLEEPQNSTVMEGERVAFQCRALNDPDATTQWIRRDSEGELANSGAETNKNVCTYPQGLL